MTEYMFVFLLLEKKKIYMYISSGVNKTEVKSSSGVIFGCCCHDTVPNLVEGEKQMLHNLLCTRTVSQWDAPCSMRDPSMSYHILPLMDSPPNLFM